MAAYVSVLGPCLQNEIFHSKCLFLAAVKNQLYFFLQAWSLLISFGSYVIKLKFILRDRMPTEVALGNEL